MIYEYVKRDDASTYSHNVRMKRILREEKIKKLKEQYWDCDKDICKANEYNDITCENCTITTHNRKIDKRIDRLNHE